MTDRVQQRRSRIIEAARALLTETGDSSAVRLDQIAARAKTTKATLYRYFPSKAALMAEASGDSTADTTGGRRREQILDAAMRVVVRHGVRGATMGRIAAAAGISTPALYWYFASKDALLRAMVARLAEQLDLVELLRAVSTADPATALSALLQRAIPRQEERIELLRVLLAEAGSHPLLTAVLYDHVVAPLWNSLARYMEHQSEVGRFRPGHSLLRVVALVGMVTFYNLARRTFGARLSLPLPEAAAAEFTQIFLQGVTGDNNAPSGHGLQAPCTPGASDANAH
jgi:AcrR family transcriptional regulator